ncbi:glutathione S-transferase [Auriculariales sp. MPI-PUGE-AT-0066]|nr:glutathione S-transferase [Auriculariales sp. MPI-PUGE-AT-0066]
MAPIVIIGNPLSTCTRRVAVVCKFIGAEYTIKSITDWSLLKQPEYLKIQPFGQVPVLEEEDGWTVYESRAISRYIVQKYGKGSSLLPPADDLRAVAAFEAAASVEQANFDKIVADIVAEKIFKPMRGAQTDEKRVADLTEALGPKLDGYERILSKTKYIASETLTVADLFHLPYGYMLEKTGSDALKDPSRPNVARWWKDISSRPEWLAVAEGA